MNTKNSKEKVIKVNRLKLNDIKSKLKDTSQDSSKYHKELKSQLNSLTQ